MLNTTTIAFTLADIVSVCGLITAVAGVIAVWVKIYTWAKKPNQRQNELIADNKKEIESIKRKLEEHDKFFDTDKQTIKAIQEENHLVMESLFALLQHGIDGNNIEPMQQAQKRIQDYLINK